MKVGTKDIQSPKTPDYKLDEPYPNPFNPSTTIHYTLGQDSNVKFSDLQYCGNKRYNCCYRKNKKREFTSTSITG